MNIEKTKTMANIKDVSSTPVAGSTSSKSEGSKSFKDELETVKTQEAAVQVQQQEETKKVEEQKTAEEKVSAQKASENQVKAEKEEAKAIEENKDPIKELKTEISYINNLKNGINPKIGAVNLKTDETLDKTAFCQIMKMDNTDINFFMGLVENQQVNSQNAQIGNVNGGISNNFLNFKTEATQKTVQVSATLLDALNDSMKTNKPFRIDFDENIAVIMKVDKNGVLSANFIPGDAAVESYLRNNIAMLQQSFNEKNLAYNELSYTKQQKQEEQNQQNNKKENENE